MTDPIQHLRPYLDAPLEDCYAMATGSKKDALILAIVAFLTFFATWGVLALITWAVA